MCIWITHACRFAKMALSSANHASSEQFSGPESDEGSSSPETGGGDASASGATGTNTSGGASAGSSSAMSTKQLAPKKDVCAVCQKSFGRIMKREHRCRRCNRKVCAKHSKERRWIPSQLKLARVCDECLGSEKTVNVPVKLMNLHLKQTRDGSTKIYKYTSKKVPGLMEGSRIVKINGTVVEGHSPQEIADRLNTIRVPFTMTLDLQRAQDRSASHAGLSHSSSTMKGVRSKRRSKSHSRTVRPLEGTAEDADLSPSSAVQRDLDADLRAAWSLAAAGGATGSHSAKGAASSSSSSSTSTIMLDRRSGVPPSISRAASNRSDESPTEEKSEVSKSFSLPMYRDRSDEVSEGTSQSVPRLFTETSSTMTHTSTADDLTQYDHSKSAEILRLTHDANAAASSSGVSSRPRLQPAASSSSNSATNSSLTMDSTMTTRTTSSNERKNARRKKRGVSDTATSLLSDAQSHCLSDICREYSVSFDRRPFGLKLTFSNSGSGGRKHWGWFSMTEHSKVIRHSKLVAVDGVWIDKCTHAMVKKLMHSDQLPMHLIFEAPLSAKWSDIPKNDQPAMIDDDLATMNAHSAAAMKGSQSLSFIMDDVVVVGTPSSSSRIARVIGGNPNHQIHPHSAPDQSPSSLDHIYLNGVLKPRSPFKGWSLFGFLHRHERVINWWIADGGWFAVIVFTAGILLILNPDMLIFDEKKDHLKTARFVQMMTSQLFYFSLPLILFVGCGLVRSLPREQALESIYVWFVKLFKWMVFTFQTRSSLPRARKKSDYYKNGVDQRGRRIGEYYSGASSASLSSGLTNNSSSVSIVRNDGMSANVKVDSGLSSIPESESHTIDSAVSAASSSVNVTSESGSRLALTDDSDAVFIADGSNLSVSAMTAVSPASSSSDRSARKARNRALKQERIRIDSPEWYEIIQPHRETAFGSCLECSAMECHVRQSKYLVDRVKGPSQESLLRLANFDIFTSDEDLSHASSHRASWFYRNRHRLPNDLFFFNVHLRLSSINLSVVIYHYLPRSLAHGLGYKPMDETGLFRRFVNGECRFRNDRLKLLARKHDGPFYFRIPSNPAIVGRQMVIKYFRCYDASKFNISTVSTGSQCYDPYDFKLLQRRAKKVKATKKDAKKKKRLSEVAPSSANIFDDNNVDPLGSGAPIRNSNAASKSDSSLTSSMISRMIEEEKTTEQHSQPFIMGSSLSSTMTTTTNTMMMSDMSMVEEDTDSGSKRSSTLDRLLEGGLDSDSSSDESETEIADMDSLDSSCTPCQCGNCGWIDNKGEYPEYIEIEMQPDGNRMANTLINLAYTISKKLSVELHWTLEGQTQQELPERIISSVRFNYVDIDQVPALD